MKKQINPNIKAHLIRSAFYVLLLLAVCVIPFALAQRNTPKASKPRAKSSKTVDKAQLLAARDRAKSAPASLTGARQVAQRKPAGAQSQLPYDVRRAPSLPRVSQVPLNTSGPLAAHAIRVLPQPKAPQVVLYDQYDNAGANATLSATFDDFPTFSSDLADDFIVPGGQTWNVESIDADGVYFNGVGPAFDWNVFIYTDSGGLPGTQVYSTLNQPVTVNGTTFTVNLTPAAVLSAGTYWIEIQPNMDFATQGEWGWTDRTVQSNNPAAWQNPGGGFGVCTTWGVRHTDCAIDPGVPDQVYRINGTTGGGGTPSPTPTGTPAGCGTYTTATGTGTITPGDVDAGNHCDDCTTAITLPFPVSVYGTTYTSVLVESNGTLQLTGDTAFFASGCNPLPNANYGQTLFPYYDDLSTDVAISPDCVNFASGCGVFTSVSGTPPNQVFNIEWRTGYFGRPGTANFEVQLSESSTDINVVYGATVDDGLAETSGIQSSSSGPATQFSCGEPTLTDGLQVTYSCAAGGASPTPTPSGTPSGCTVTGSLDPSDPTQTDRLFRSGIPQTCPASTTCAIFGDPTPHHYDAYTFTNTTGAPQCVTVTTTAECTFNTFIAAYLGSFDPANICTNWIGDSGSSPDPTTPVTFSFDVNDGDTFVLVVSEVTPEGGCTSYTMTITPQSICGGGASPTPSPSPTCPAGNPVGAPGPWTAASPYPLNIVRYGFAQTATHLYVFGGVADGTRVTNVNRFDLATGTWEPRAPMPWESEAPTCALMESTGIVYCAEGDLGNQFASYDIATDTWTPLAADPFVTDHYGSASGAFNGKVFVVGGTTAFSNAIWIYDVAMNTWSVGTAVPTGPFLLAGYQQVGQFLYVVGGFDPSAINLTTTSRLDMSSAPGVWDVGPAFTPQRADFGLAYDAGTNKLYALGGDLGNDGNFFNSTNLVDELDVSAWPGGTWNPSPPDLPAPNRQANQAGFYGNGDIWSVGGINGATFQFLNEVWHRNNGGGVVCPSPTPTPTPTITPTPSVPPVTPTPTPTVTPTPSVPPVTPTPTPTETPRPTPTPRPRPTPHPRP